MNSFVTAARNAGASFTRRTQISWRMIIAAFALLIALIASFLAFRYLNYRNAPSICFAFFIKFKSEIASVKLMLR